MRSNSAVRVLRMPAACRRSARHRDRDRALRSALEFGQFRRPTRSRSRHPRSGRGSGPSRACRDASSETTAACGGRPARRSIVSIPSFRQSHSNAESPDVPGGADIAHRRSPMSALVRASIASSLPDLSRPSTSCEIDVRVQPTAGHDDDELDAPRPAQSAVCAGHHPARRRAEAGQAVALSARARRDAAAGRSAAASAGQRRSTAARGRRSATPCRAPS